MHGVDWDGVYERYAKMVDDAASREDVSFIIGEMISELNVGHAYYWGGDVDGAAESRTSACSASTSSSSPTARREVSGFRIARMYEGASWDTDARNPLTHHGMDVEVGDFITHVNGAAIDVEQGPVGGVRRHGRQGDDDHRRRRADGRRGDDERPRVHDHAVGQRPVPALPRLGRGQAGQRRRGVGRQGSGTSTCPTPA